MEVLVFINSNLWSRTIINKRNGGSFGKYNTMKRTMFIILISIGCVLVYFATHFSLASDEYLRNLVRSEGRNLWLGKTAGGAIVGGIWSILGYFIFDFFASAEYPAIQIKFWRYLLLSNLIYVFISSISSLMFILQFKQ